MSLLSLAVLALALADVVVVLAACVAGGRADDRSHAATDADYLDRVAASNLP